MHKHIALALAASLAAVGGCVDHRSMFPMGTETLGPDKSPYARRNKKGKGERKANRRNRWG